MAHPDLNGLLNAQMGLPFAKKLLKECGEFYPFGIEIGLDGKFAAVGAWDGDEHPPSEKLIELLTLGFKRKAENGQLRAAGIFYDVRIIPPEETEKCAAVCASVEHQSGEAFNAYLPYKRNENGEIQYGKLFARRRTPQFFTQRTGTV